MHDIAVSGNGYASGGHAVNSRLALPMDLHQSAEEVCMIHEDANLSNFRTNVLSLVKNEKKVLIIFAHSFSKLDLVKSKLPQDSLIVHAYDEANEEEACEWISGKSGKKFLIADHQTAAGYEFDTVIVVTTELRKDRIASVCQRATARLIICIYM